MATSGHAVEIGGGFAWVALTGGDRVHGTNDRLRFAPRLGPGATLTFFERRRMWIEVSSAASFVPASMRAADGTRAHGGRAIIGPLTAAVLVPLLASHDLQMFAGAGILYMVIRRSFFPIDVADPNVTRLEQPDHPAVLLEGGARYRLRNRWALVTDVKYGPVPSTVEVHATQSLHRTLQANVHPLVLGTNLAWRF
jgi:outer membrane protein W